MSTPQQSDGARVQPSAGPCRTGCRTQDHATWGDCARDMGLQIGDLGRGVAARTDRRLDAYATARGLGLQPPTTKIADSTRTLREAGA